MSLLSPISRGCSVSLQMFLYSFKCVSRSHTTHLCVSEEDAPRGARARRIISLEIKRQNLMFVDFSQLILHKCFSPRVLLLALSEEGVVSVVFCILNNTQANTAFTPPHPSGRRFPSPPLFSSLSLVIQIYLQSGHLLTDISTHAVQPFFLPPQSDGGVKRLSVWWSSRQFLW